ncbi:microtubule associated-domain-containing protein, partial [Phyllosticta citricarpa]
MAHSTQDDDDVRLFDHSDSELPPLPPDDDESFLRPPSDLADGSQLGSNDGNSLMEREMNRKLLDIESSFLPDADLPSTDDRPKGADDTYVFGAMPEETLAKEQDNGNTVPKTASPHAEDIALPDTPPTAPDALKNQAPGREAEEHTYEHYDDSHMGDNSSEAPAPSSPAAAAAARSNSRTVPQNEPEIETSRADEHEGQVHEDETHSARPTSSASTVKATLESNTSAEPAEGGSRLWGDSVNSNTSTLRTSNSSTNLRPRSSFLRDRSRQASYRSSASSTGAQSGGAPEVQDNTLASDFALQSGGAMPSSSLRNSYGDLSRLPSLGSVASSISALSDEGASRGSYERAKSTLSNLSGMDANLDSLEEEPRAGSASPPVTPRPGTAGTNAPTDTVITKHVQNILVPDTVAKEYREKHGERSPDKRASTASFAFSSRTKHNLTLKEQNSKIDKLSKENFDLKLKIHFLDQALQNRSDEGVKDMISKNVQLQTDLANEKKETQSLKRKMRELERKLKAQEEGMAKNKDSGTGSDDERSDNERIQQDMEEEITYLRECLQNSEVEIERLREDTLAKEVEKRRMAEYVKSMGDRKNSEPKAGVEEAMEMWKDLLEAETARREQADEDAERLREEVRRLRAEREQPNHSTANTRNNYNASRQSRVSYARSQSGSEGTAENRASTSLSGVTLVEQLK